MTDTPLDSRPTPPRSLTGDVFVLAVAGLALGIGFNALQLAGDPARALPWLRMERHLASLERIDPPAAARPAASAATATPDPAPPAPRASATPAPDSTRATAAVTAKGRPATTAKAGKVPAHRGSTPATPAHATTTTPAPAAPATSTPAPAPAATTSAADLPQIPDSREPIEIKLDVARRFHTAGAALFVDARTAEEFASGHIAGAVNLSFDDTFRNPALVKGLDPKGRPMIVYCGGGDCELSRNLAFSMIEAGYHKVLVYTGGIKEWIAVGAPLRSGAQP